MSLRVIKAIQDASLIELPPLEIFGVSVILVLVLLLQFLADHLKRKIIGIQSNQKNVDKRDSLEMKYFYHLAIIMVVVPEVSWNIFDLSIWIFSYIAVGIVRNLFYDIQAQKSNFLNGPFFDRRLENLLTVSLKLSAGTLGVALAYIGFANWYFTKASIKVNQILLYPTILLLLDSIYMLFSCQLIRNKIVNFLNNNIDSEFSGFRLQSVYTLIKCLLNLLHFSYLMKIFYRTTYSFYQLFSSPYIIPVLRAIYESVCGVLKCLIEYQKFVDLLTRMNVFLPEAAPEPGIECAICQQQLLSCREIKQCGHKFHFKCIFSWVRYKQMPLCPVCRSIIIRSKHFNRNYYERDEEF